MRRPAAMLIARSRRRGAIGCTASRRRSSKATKLVRAVQTAEIVALTAKIENPVEVRREMSPGGDPLALVGELFAAKRKRVMVVGHEPDLSMLVQRLVHEVPEAGMQKAMVVGIKLGDEGSGMAAKLRFVLDPKSCAWHRA
jgi:phosphohistidine phosphatase